MLEMRKLSKVFNAGTPNEVRALQGVDCTLEEGAFVVIIGTNGSGKSTLLNAVAGTFLVDVGTISLDGIEVTRWPEHRRASLMGRVFQNPFSGTAPNLTIAETRGAVSLVPPDGWQAQPDKADVAIGGGQTAAVTFTPLSGYIGRS